MRFLTCCLLSSTLAFPVAAQAVTFKPLIETRLRYENVKQAGNSNDANAITVRTRFGAEASTKTVSVLIEGEGTYGFDSDYFSGVNRKTTPIVADPNNIELNRIQVQYKGVPKTVVTVGRQRINLDDQRFVGSVGWRDNEQTFDAIRVENTAIKNLKIDVTYSWSDRTIWGIDGGKNGFATRPQSIDGDNVFANAAYKTKYGLATAFYYRVDEDELNATLRRNSSATYGGRFAGTYAFSKTIKWNYAVSYARQTSNKTNPLIYAADYYLADGSLDIKALKLGAGVEVLGGDSSVRTKATGALTTFAFQTPFATLHKFQGWADKFLTTPTQGIVDYYASAGYGWKKVGLFDTIGISAIYHRFDSDVGKINFGEEYDAQIVAKVKKYTFTAKYADYQRKGIASFAGDADTKKFWLSAEWAF